MQVHLFALFAACTIGCVADGPLAGTDSPASETEGDVSLSTNAENIDKMLLADAAAAPSLDSTTVSIDLRLGTAQVGFATMSSDHTLSICSFVNSTGGGVIVDVDPGSGIL